MSQINSNSPEGILLVDKPKGMTSHDVVARMRRLYKLKKVGHAGTLDPMATGLLLIMLGKATKVSQFLMSHDKTYTGTLKLGQTTDSQDAEGELMSERPVPALESIDLEGLVASFWGDQYQTPPMFSAKKVKGVPLYKLARQGKEVEREPRFIHVSRMEISRIELPEVDFELHCSKGTYVRTVASDFGKKCDCGAHLIALRRISSGELLVDDAVTLPEIDEMDLGQLKERVLPVYRVVPAHVLP